jgi:hypothetical protein
MKEILIAVYLVFLTFVYLFLFLPSFPWYTNLISKAFGFFSLFLFDPLMVLVLFTPVIAFWLLPLLVEKLPTHFRYTLILYAAPVIIMLSIFWFTQ